MKLIFASSPITIENHNEISKLFSHPLSEVKVIYINTSTIYHDKEPSYSIESKNALKEVFRNIVTWDFAQKTTQESKDLINTADLVFFGPGETYLLTYWVTQKGLYNYLKERSFSGNLVLGGESGGALFMCGDIIVYRPFLDKSVVPEVIEEGLGLVDFYPLPHYNDERYGKDIKEIEKKLRSSGESVIPINNNQIYVFEG